MSTMKRIVCLANSRMLSGRCIAGIELDPSGRRVGWIRPVSDRENGEVSEYERAYENGSDPAVLDVVDVRLLEPRPHDYQRENWLLDPGFYWVKAGTVSWVDLETVKEEPGRLWLDGNSTHGGMNDRIALASAHQLDSSLCLIRVPWLVLGVVVYDPPYGRSSRRVQARFVHGTSEYWLWVTDPIYETRYLGMPNAD